jgi:hypothetical protein
MNDEIDYPAMWYPTHIVSKDKKLLPVYIGASNNMIVGYFGIYVKDKDYNKIRHDKTYIFIHNPEAEDEDIQDVDWEKVDDVTDNKLTNREHIHIWVDPEFKGDK